jgi:Spy/CpxP family protein refolding chaperone
MDIRSKLAVAIVVVALGCMPALAQQAAPDDPPAEAQGGWAGPGPGGPGGPGMRGGQVRVRVERWQGRGFGARRHGRRMGGDMGMGFGMGGFGLDVPLDRAMRALHDPQIRQQVGISDEEASKLEQDVTNFRKANIQDRANLEIARIDLQNLLAAETPDQAAVDSKLQEVGAAQLALEKAAVDFAVTLKTEIPQAQRDKIRQLLRERRGMGAAPGGTRRGAPGGARGQRRGRRAGGAGQAPNPQGQSQGGTPPPPPNN